MNWHALESIPGPCAVWPIWRLHLGSDFQAFKAAFLKSMPDHPARFVPCYLPLGCGCQHEVIARADGSLGAACRCPGQPCGTYTVTRDDITPLELDWPRLARALSAALGFNCKLARLAPYNTFQLGFWSADAVPVLLTIQSHEREFLHAVTSLIPLIAKPFILLSPTARHLGLAAKELLATAGAACFALEQCLRLDPSGDLVAAISPSKLFADVAPLLPPPSDEDLARRTFLALQEPDHASRLQPPTLYAVFQLYCVQDLTIPQIARKCRCSTGTVANRLKLLQARTGVAPEFLRRVAPQFTKFEDDFRQAKRNFRLRR